MNTPSMAQVAQSILDICPEGRTDVFKPSVLRVRLERFFPDTPAANLNAQMQPFMRLFREHEIIVLLQTHQKRNRPHQIKNRSKLREISQNPHYILPTLGYSMGAVELDEDEIIAVDSIDPQKRLAGVEEDIVELQRNLYDAQERIARLEEALVSLNKKLQTAAELLAH